MYVPSHFAADAADVEELLARHGAADLVTTIEGLLATLLPFVHDPETGDSGALLGHVARNNEQCKERAVGRRWPSSVDRTPTSHRPDVIAGQLRAIVSMELRITRIEAKLKLSQNRSAADGAGVVDGSSGAVTRIVRRR